jgi:hypothetical protein
MNNFFYFLCDLFCYGCCLFSAFPRNFISRYVLTWSNFFLYISCVDVVLALSFMVFSAFSTLVIHIILSSVKILYLFGCNSHRFAWLSNSCLMQNAVRGVGHRRPHRRLTVQYLSPSSFVCTV